MSKPIRVMIAKPGLDGHDRGAVNLVMGLRDCGMEVIYLGIKQTVEGIVRSCIQEDVDVLGLSSLSGGHNYYFPKITELLKEKATKQVLIIGGGIIPKEDRVTLKERGIKEIFGPGTKIQEVVDFIRENVKP
jgi:methylmalonyl-CoA mutase C-terminal domain/subunit